MLTMEAIRKPCAILVAISMMGSGTLCVAQTGTAKKPPVIKHQPVPVAVVGQSIAIKATVTDETAVKSVTLYYSTSQDVAPFKIEMQAASPSVYLCTIPANLLSRASQVTYYIEALNDADVTAETPWYKVAIQAPQPGTGAAAKSPGDASGENSSWTTPALIAGGAILLAGGAAAVYYGTRSSGSSDNSNGGGGGGGGSTNTQDVAGTYVGSVSTTLQIGSVVASNSNHAVTFAISTAGLVSTSDIMDDGRTLQASLSGANFTLVATLTGTNLTGQVQYLGSVVDSRITGSVGGTVQTSSGTNGTYYGTFYAVKQ